MAGYVPVSLICMNLTMSYSELPDISSKLSKGTAAAAILCHESMETDGQDEHVCYLDNFLKKFAEFPFGIWFQVWFWL